MILEPGTTLAKGKYTLLQCIGKGAHGEAWKAEQRGVQDFRQQVVLKLLTAKHRDNPSFVQMFCDEARLAACLNHAHIIKIHDLGEDEDAGLVYISMAHIQGHDLSIVLKQCLKQMGQPIPYTLVARMMIEICDGLQYAHTFADERGQSFSIVHRDIKPSNILLSQDGYTHIIDFGIAKAMTNRELTNTGQVKGTPLYMAPEQLMSPKNIDHRADLFSLGSVFYHLCSGNYPFCDNDVGNVYEALGAIMSDNRARPFLECQPGFPPELHELVLRMLEKEPALRPQSALEVKQTLEQILTQHVIHPTHSDIQTFYRSLFPFETPAPAQVQENITDSTFDPKTDSFPTPVQPALKPIQQSTPTLSTSLELSDTEKTVVQTQLPFPEPQTTKASFYTRIGLVALFLIVGTAVAFAVWPTQKPPALEPTHDGGLIVDTQPVDIPAPTEPTPEKKPIPEKRTERVSKKTPEARPDPQPPKPRPQRPRFTGVYIRIRPNCKLTQKVGGRYVSFPQKKRRRLSQGLYTFRCYNRKIRLDVRFNLRVRKSRISRFIRTYRLGHVHIDTGSSKARICVQGFGCRRGETTPGRISLYARKKPYTLVLIGKGQRKETKVRVRSGRTTRIQVNFTP